MVQVQCISGSHRLKIDFQDTNYKKSSCLKPLIFGMKHHLVDLNQACTNYAPGAKNGPIPGGHIFYIGIYRENMKTSFCLKLKVLEL